jgi:hypothetical protein
MARKKTRDPKLIALHDKHAKAQHAFSRWYTRLKRAFTNLERERRRIDRLQRQIRKLEEAA